MESPQYYDVQLGVPQELFPNLQSLDFLDDPIGLFWTNITHERSSGNWQQLKIIPSPYSSDFSNYAYAAIACSGTLERLSLFCLAAKRVTTSEDLSIHFNKIIKDLKSFVNLKKLYIRVVGGRSELYYFDNIINDFLPSLDSLFVDGMKEIGDVPYNLTSSGSSLESLQPSPHITTLFAEYYPFSQDSTQYLMNKFSNIQKIFISKAWEIFRNLSLKVQMDFFQYISSVKKFELFGDDVQYYDYKGNEADDNRLLELVKCFMVASAKTVALNLDVKVKIVYDRKKFIDDYGEQYNDIFDDNHYPDLIIRHNVGLECGNKLIDYYQDWAGGNSDTISLGVRFKNTMENADELYKALIIEHGSRFGQLYFSSISEKSPILCYHSDDDQQIETMNNYLDLNFGNCNNLTNLSLNWMKLSKSNENPPIANNNITHLDISYSLVLPGVLQEYSSCLPSLKYLYLKNCQFDDDTVSNNYIHINMPHTSFDTLSWSTEYFYNYLPEDYPSWHVRDSYSLKFVTSDNSNYRVKYFYIDKLEGLQKSAQGEYFESVDCNDYFTIDVVCRKISCFIIRLADRSAEYYNAHHTVYLDNN